MTQRKLTDEELQSVVDARHCLRKVTSFGACPVYMQVVLQDLDAVADHGTTDGKPYVEPQPEIGDGYRLATEADAARPDCEFRKKYVSGWQRRKVLIGKPFLQGYYYRVPVIPDFGEGYRRATEEDRHRRDRQGIFKGEWVQAAMGICFTGVTYRVPIDRIPTDEDAVGRPTVMVRDRDDQPYKPAVLYGVKEIKLNGFSVLADDMWSCYCQCRFPYPGELD